MAIICVVVVTFIHAEEKNIPLIIREQNVIKVANKNTFRYLIVSLVRP